MSERAYKLLTALSLTIWASAWCIAFAMAGCSGGGEDDTSATESSSANTTRSPSCYFTDSGVNLGQIGTEQGEEAASDAEALKENLIVQACGDVTIDQSVTSPVTTTTTTVDNSEKH